MVVLVFFLFLVSRFVLWFLFCLIRVVFTFFFLAFLFLLFHFFLFLYNPSGLDVNDERCSDLVRN